MTAKQKAARAKFKAIVKEASKLRKKNPKLTQAQAVKQAWAISYSTKKISGSNYSGRSVEIRPASASSKKFIVWDTKTNQIFANEKFDSYSEAVQFIRQNKLKLKNKKIGAVKKKSAPTKVKAKKRAATEMHTDTKSHNVNIRVISGIDPLTKKIQDGISLISRELKEVNSKIKTEKNKFLKSAYLNRKRFLLNELKIGKQLLRKYK